MIRGILSRTNNKGFTLVELGVVIGILATLLGIATISLSGAQQKASINTTVQTIISDMKQQQIKAMIGDTEGRSTTDSYGIHFESNQYILFHKEYLMGDSTNFAIDLAQNFQFESPGTNVIFQKISGEISADSISSITLLDTTNGNKKTITINKYGVIMGIN